MIVHEEKKKKKKSGRGLVNNLINNLPFEAHIPGYQYCGPGTKLHKRLARGDPGINPLDAACKVHDIAYSKNKDIQARNVADRVLAEKAWQRVQSSDASLGEKAAAYAVTNIMKAKSTFGMGLGKKRRCKRKKVSKNKRKTLSLKKLISTTKKFTTPSNDSKVSIKSALRAARKTIKSVGGKKSISLPRVLPVPKLGGFLPALIPVFAGLSALGSLAGGAAGIAQAVNRASAARKQLEEQTRHNKRVEALAVGKGLYLRPYQTGYGLTFNKSTKTKKTNIKKKKKVVKRKKKLRCKTTASSFNRL